jgi:hypothetical protein
LTGETKKAYPVSEKTVDWQPISALPMIGSMIDDWLNEVEELYANLDACRSNPHVLDDSIVERVMSVYSAQAGDVWLYEEQLSRWRSLTLPPQQCQELARLTAQVLAIRERITAILALAEELKKGTIESVLAKSDLDLGLEALLAGKL